MVGLRSGMLLLQLLTCLQPGVGAVAGGRLAPRPSLSKQHHEAVAGIKVQLLLFPEIEAHVQRD